MTDDYKKYVEFSRKGEGGVYSSSDRKPNEIYHQSISTFDPDTVTTLTMDTVNMFESFRWDSANDVVLDFFPEPPESDLPVYHSDYCNIHLRSFECFTALLDIDVLSLIKELYNERVKNVERNKDGYYRQHLTPDIVKAVTSVCDKYCSHKFVSSVLLKGKVLNALKNEQKHYGFRSSLGIGFSLLMDVKDYILNGDYHDLNSFDLLDKYHFHELLELINFDDKVMTVAQLIADSRLVGSEFKPTLTAVEFLRKNRSAFNKYEELSKSGTKREFEIHGDPLDYYLLLMLREIAVQKLWIRRCNNCGRFFVAERNNILYCDRKLKKGSKRTCRDVGARLTHSNKVKEDPHESLRIRIYKRLHMNAERHKDIPEYMTRFEEFKKVSAEMKTKYTDGTITEKEYHDYLVSEDERGSRL